MSEEFTHRKIDRQGWPAGEWDKEPDRLQWQHAGYACLAVRNSMGAWCGYVGLDASHPYYGKHYDECDVAVHGGLTYSARCQGAICHAPEPGMPDDVWWLGFDCAHAFDLVPRCLAIELELPVLRKYASATLREDTYRDLAYAKAETERLAEQLQVLKEEVS